MTPGETLRALRLRNGLTQAQLAEKAGLDRSWVNQMERGNRRITRSPRAKLAAALGVTPLELGGLEEESPPEFHSLDHRLTELEEQVATLIRLTGRLGRRVAALEREGQPTVRRNKT